MGDEDLMGVCDKYDMELRTETQLSSRGLFVIAAESTHRMRMGRLWEKKCEY